VHPILFELPFGLHAYAYGFMLCVSVLAGRLLALHLAERDGLDPALMNRATVWALAGAIIGARLLFVVTAPDQIDRFTDIFRFWKGGVVAYGGFLGGFAGTVIFCRRHGVSLMRWVDCVAPALCLGLMVTRIGCFLAGCDYGQPWDGAWSVEFPAGSIAFREQVQQGLLSPSAAHSLAVHPTQLYESLAGAVLLAAVMAARARRVFAGQAFMVFVAGYAVLRSLIEVYRGDLGRGSVGPLSTSQAIAVVTCLAAIAASYMLWRKRSSGGSVPCANF
jgi:phosphatidylglycerol---prolipoprotein diacylglyceryl transferase